MLTLFPPEVCVCVSGVALGGSSDTQGSRPQTLVHVLTPGRAAGQATNGKQSWAAPQRTRSPYKSLNVRQMSVLWPWTYTAALTYRFTQSCLHWPDPDLPRAQNQIKMCINAVFFFFGANACTLYGKMDPVIVSNINSSIFALDHSVCSDPDGF